MPNVLAWTLVLSGICAGNKPFVWRPIHQKSFDEIWCIACKSPILKAINWDNPKTVFVVCDAHLTGVGGLLCQGDDWKLLQLAAFMSKKFTAAQQNYFTYEHETLGVIECLLKWQDK